VAVYALGDLCPDIHPTAYVHPDATVIGDVRIGAHASIWPQVVLRADDNHVRIGARTNVQDGSVLHAAPETPVTVGEGTVIGHCVHIEGASVGAGCLIASGSILLNSTVIEDGAAVGAGALISFDGHVPTGQIALGVPARNRENTFFPMAEVATIVADYVRTAELFRAHLRRLD
jgi:carbonic anhydrase/acetyltransferase-like protein (isoleucine patch superfamily)